MRPTFDAIRRTDENGNEYWSSRDLCNAMGYSTNWKFQNVINKAIAVANQKGMNIDDRFGIKQNTQDDRLQAPNHQPQTGK